MAKKYDESEGVWRTIGGRRVFIRKGQSLADAMAESGKFKNLRETYRKQKEKDKNKLEELKQKSYQDGEEGHKGYQEYKQKLEEFNKKYDKEEKRKIETEYALNFGDSSDNYRDTKDVPFSDKVKAVNEYKSEVYGEKNDKYKIKGVEDTGGGVKVYGGEVGDYTFIASEDGIEYFDKKQGMTLDKYLSLEDDAYAGKYGKGIRGAYDYEQKYAKFGVVSEEIENKIMKDITNGNYDKNYIEEAFENIKSGKTEESLKQKFGVSDKYKSIDELNNEMLGNEYKGKGETPSLVYSNGRRIDIANNEYGGKTAIIWKNGKIERKTNLPENVKGDKTKDYFDKYLSDLDNQSNDKMNPTTEDKDYRKIEKQLLEDYTKVDTEDLKTYRDIFKEQGKEKFVSRLQNEIDRRIANDNSGKETKETGNDYLPKETKITTAGKSNRKEVSDNIQAHILEHYDNPVDFMEQMDAFDYLPTKWKAGEEIAKGGSYLIYNGDMADYLDSLNINPKGKKFSEEKSFDMYTSLVGRESEKLYNRLDKLFEQYKKEHKNSNATLEDFRKWFK